VIIYFSGGGVTGVWQRVNDLLIERRAARLLSFAYSKLLFQYCDRVKHHAVRSKVMVDSGAFTAWSKGTSVELDDLSDLFKRLQDAYSEYCEFVLINLDVIPGSKGVDPTAQELIDAQRRSEENFAILNARFPGLVLPVFHQGESDEYYDALVSASQYVCISPRNDLPEKLRVEWSRRFCNRTRRKFHGLAATGLTMMETVPWHSVDSAAWVMVGGYGGIFYRTASKLQVLTVSAQSPSVKDAERHIRTLKPHMRAYVLDTINAKGYDIAKLESDDTERYCWNAECWLDLKLKDRLVAPNEDLF
jgi:hypothetical protein